MADGSKKPGDMDPRILVYRSAALAMQDGDFQVEVPIGKEDDIGLLGKELRELGKSLEKKFEEINMLTRVTEEVNAGLILDEVLDHVFNSFRPIIPYNRIGFSLLEDEGRVVRARWARSDSPVMKITGGYEAEMQGSSLRKIMQSGQPRILNDLQTYLEVHPDSDSTRRIVEEGMKSSLTCPLIAMSKPIGFMFFSSFEKNTYENAHVEVFKQIAGQLAVIVEKSRLYQQLVDLNELKNKFLGIAAHDLRNPIGIIKGFTEILLQDMLGEIRGQQREFIEKIRKASNTMLNLVNDLLDVSAIEAGRLDLHLQDVDLSSFLKECHESNRLLAQNKSIELKLDCPGNLPNIKMDMDRINQVVNNLITNAIKFSHPETVITMGAERKGEKVHVWVKDQGQGIPPDEIPKVFAEFGKTSVRPTAGEKSTGLGLAICKRMIEAHGGAIRVESKVGEGSIFTFQLPLHGPESTMEESSRES